MFKVGDKIIVIKNIVPTHPIYTNPKYHVGSMHVIYAILNDDLNVSIRYYVEAGIYYYKEEIQLVNTRIHSTGGNI